MTMAERIKIVIGKDGGVTVDVSGVKGNGCKALTKAIQDGLGVTTSDKSKAEMYETVTTGTTAKTGYSSEN